MDLTDDTSSYNLVHMLNEPASRVLLQEPRPHDQGDNRRLVLCRQQTKGRTFKVKVVHPSQEKVSTTKHKYSL
jgi:hypothetical protein